MIDLKFKYKNLFNFIERRLPFTPDLTVVLGSGLGDFVSSVNAIDIISTSEIPDYPTPTILGHKGEIIFGSYLQKNLLLFKGRVHFYEKYLLEECILPAFISSETGCKKIILTNAAGGINRSFIPGDLMLAVSFNAMNLKKELVLLLAQGDKEREQYYVILPSDELNIKIKRAAKEENIQLKEGVYWYTKGPSYETPAEIEMIAKFGGDAVGMSTVYEAFYAASKGIETASISCISNYAAGISNNKLNHVEVIAVADLVKQKFEKLLKETIKILND